MRRTQSRKIRHLKFHRPFLQLNWVFGIVILEMIEFSHKYSGIILEGAPACKHVEKWRADRC